MVCDYGKGNGFVELGTLMVWGQKPAPGFAWVQWQWRWPGAVHQDLGVLVSDSQAGGTVVTGKGFWKRLVRSLG